MIIIIIYTYCVPECQSSSLTPLFQSIHGNSGRRGGSEQGGGPWKPPGSPGFNW